MLCHFDGWKHKKEGYYIEFNNTLRIGISDLNNNSQTIRVNFTDIEDDDDPRINENIPVSVGQTYTLAYKDYQYQITLNYIGAAGRNPFTKAAYITVATYKKQ